MKFTFWAVFNFAILFLACESSEAEIARRADAAKNKNSGTSAKPDGMVIFKQNCVVCHGADGKLGSNGAKDLTASALPLEGRVQIITNGKNLMTPFKAVLTPEEIEAVAQYTLNL